MPESALSEDNPRGRASHGLLDAFGHAAAVIASRQRFLTLAHPRMDGDALGSCLALTHILRALGKEARCLRQEPFDRTLDFLPGADQTIDWQGAWGDEAWYPEVLIACDVGSYARVEEVVVSFGMNCAVLNIDHHASNPEFGSVSLCDTSAAATGEVIYRLAKHAGYPIPQEAALCLFVALSTDTGSFRHSNTTPEVLRVAAELVATGIDVANVSRRLYRDKSLARLKLEALVIARLQVTAGGRLATASLSRQDFHDAGIPVGETSELVNLVKSVDGTQVAVLLSEVAQPGVVKVSFRGEGFHDLNVFASRFGGGGHARAAGARIDGTLQAVTEQVVAALRPLCTAESEQRF